MISYLIPLCLVISGSWCAHWSYGGQDGDWSKVSKECKIGRAQSPIDIITSKVKWDKTLHLKYNNFDQPINGKHVLLQNNGHSVQLSLDKHALNDSLPTVSGSALGVNVSYEFVQLHFHWDEDDTHGSEHAIDGHRYALEMHYVMANSKYGGDVSKAADHKDGLVVLASIFHASDKNDTYMQPLLNGLDKVEEEGTNTTLKGETILLDHILPDDRDLFFKYEGSLTTPPCSQAVTWIVYRDISAINEEQLNAFRELKTHDVNNNGIKIGHNVRELQLQEDRDVFGSVGPRRGQKPHGFVDHLHDLLGWNAKEPAIKLL